MTLERAGDAAAGVRVAVEDDGPVGVEAVLPRTPAGDDLDWDELDATGRGLTIVAMLAGRWGVDETLGGKRVWADLAGRGAAHEALDPERAEPDAGPAEGELPPGWALVRLVQCPVALSLRQDSHLDELVRELQLLGVDEHNHESAAIAEEIQGLLVSPTHARLTGRRAAEQARGRRPRVRRHRDGHAARVRRAGRAAATGRRPGRPAVRGGPVADAGVPGRAARAAGLDDPRGARADEQGSGADVLAGVARRHPGAPEGRLRRRAGAAGPARARRPPHRLRPPRARWAGRWGCRGTS